MSETSTIWRNRCRGPLLPPLSPIIIHWPCLPTLDDVSGKSHSSFQILDQSHFQIFRHLVQARVKIPLSHLKLLPTLSCDHTQPPVSPGLQDER